MDDDELRELRAYKVGYDLGFYRGVESVSDKIQEISDLIERSATFRLIQEEAKGKGAEVPIFFAELIAALADVATFKRELMPTLLVERKAINRMGRKIAEVPLEAFTGENLEIMGIENIVGEENIGGESVSIEEE